MTTKVLTVRSAIDEVNGDSKARFTATATREAASPVPSRNRRVILSALFSENVVAKILRTATEKLANNSPPVQYPHLVSQTGSIAGVYQSQDIAFWTCGFFPGCIYSLLERSIKYPHRFSTGLSNISSCIDPLDNKNDTYESSSSSSSSSSNLREQLKSLGLIWSNPIHDEVTLTNTHDLGFIIMPHMRPRWELFHDQSALDSILTAAQSLCTRFNATVGAIRSWDAIFWQNPPAIPITDMSENFLVIIDSMCNLDLLFYAAAHSGKRYLADVAIKHARTLMATHLRPEGTLRGITPRHKYKSTLYSTYHVVNFDPITGGVKTCMTVQGYDVNTTWSRGQAWAILGYAQTYAWTGEPEFLDIACGLAEYYLLKLETAPPCVEVEVQRADLDCENKYKMIKTGRYVPLWDFDAPLDDSTSPPLRDTSAGMVAANGLLILSQSLSGQAEHELSARYLDAALRVVQETIECSLAPEKARLSSVDGEIKGEDVEQGRAFEAILKNATVSNNSLGRERIKDHGLVYADYYFIEVGNRLLRMGLA